MGDSTTTIQFTGKERNAETVSAATENLDYFGAQPRQTGAEAVSDGGCFGLAANPAGEFFRVAILMQTDACCDPVSGPVQFAASKILWA
ncbi:MAG TPA: hypothetical protein VJN43_18895 [Bryobacteraceae bacterium]|nr:hypothetical protein [Bryobacteraceae bacterium]